MSRYIERAAKAAMQHIAMAPLDPADDDYTADDVCECGLSPTVEELQALKCSCCGLPLVVGYGGTD